MILILCSSRNDKSSISMKDAVVVNNEDVVVICNLMLTVRFVALLAKPSFPFPSLSPCQPNKHPPPNTATDDDASKPNK